MIYAQHALLGAEWARDVRVTVRAGTITGVERNVPPLPGDVRVDTLLPAPANLHSHAFQRAMAGRTEFRKAGRDSFWTWREVMYRFVDRLTPEQIEAIAAFAFMEMQEAGYAAVGEFHYLHHQRGGAPYDDRAELSCRIMAAAQQTGIGLTHLPVLYSYGGAGRVPLEPGQLRFGNDVAAFLDLTAAARTALRDLPKDARIGLAPHSLRATAPEDLRTVLAAHDSGPIHIHAAEQPAEVAAIEAWLGQRPVAWLLDQAGVNPDWCLIHATHMTPDETRRLAASGATAGLCPVTEANLGDGPFNGAAYLRAGGGFGLGTDSNIAISLFGELRILEYSQRLRDLARNVLIAGEGSVGQTLYIGAARGGAQALGRKAGVIATDHLADLVAIDSTHPSLCALPRAQILDGLVFACESNAVTDLWSAGRHAVKAGRHIARAPITAAWRAAIAALTTAA
ncbi:formimidoylglutamate deiminase [Pontibaca salina]|uniref:Formimidoylglutamate deiminase n=1 Tax=Pontibaca salina TaxID=2795731 RepID=A0A934HTK1_9RHOB|nr:formimidoylglutamate deiminase [Pontibaca salina]